MAIDYSPFLHVSENGSIWWRTEDAIKLGAGYLPIRDDKHNLAPVLRAPTNQVLVNQRTLIGALGQGYTIVAQPRFLERDDGPYIEAHEFLQWLADYLTMTQAGEILFPSDLAHAVRYAGGSPAVRSPEPASFESLTAELDGWFDKPLAELPNPQRNRVETDLPTGLWDHLSADQRRRWATDWDYQHDPATGDERVEQFNRFVEQDHIERQILELELMAAHTPLERESKMRQLVELRQQLDRVQARTRYTSEVADRGKSHWQALDNHPKSSTRYEKPDAHQLGEYVHFLNAKEILKERLGATPEEIAMWVWLGKQSDELR